MPGRISQRCELTDSRETYHPLSKRITLWKPNQRNFGDLGGESLLLVEMFPATHSRDSRVNAGLW